MTKGDFCNEKDRKKCSEEQDPEHLEWSCENCPKIRDWQMHPYTAKLLTFRKLSLAGFPMDSEMLTYEEWLDLGRINECLTAPS